MGLLGAIGGTGKGLQGYSQILTDQRRQDWESQKLQLQHERQLNLEQLRAKNNMAVQDKGFEQQKELQDRGYGRESIGYYEGKPISREEYSALEKAGQVQEGKFKTPEEYKTDVEVDRATKVAEATSKFKRDELQKEWKEFTKTEAYDAMSPAQKQLAELKILHPVASQLIEGSEKLSPEDKVKAGNLYKDFYDKGIELWDKMEPRDQKAFKKQLPEGEVPENYFASWYAQDQLNRVGLGDIFGMGRGMSGPQDTGVPMDIKNPKEVANMAEDIQNNDPEATALYQSLPEGAPLKLKLDKILGQTETGREGGGGTTSALSSVTQGKGRGGGVMTGRGYSVDTAPMQDFPEFNAEDIPIVGRIIQDYRRNRQSREGNR